MAEANCSVEFVGRHGGTSVIMSTITCVKCYGAIELNS